MNALDLKVDAMLIIVSAMNSHVIRLLSTKRSAKRIASM